MVTIFACDIGCKNFAYIIVNINTSNPKPISILHWEILNICSDVCLCSKELKNGSHCCSKAIVIDNSTGMKFCKKHTPANVKTNKIKLNDKDNLYSYGRNMYDLLDDRPFILDCDSFIIENQPNTLNPTMKSISIILYSYFIHHRINNVHFINANLKLKLNSSISKSYLDNSKNKYKLTKKLGIGYCKYILNFETSNYLDYFEYFNNHSKKDDLADALLHAYVFFFKINHLNNNPVFNSFIHDFMK